MGPEGELIGIEEIHTAGDGHGIAGEAQAASDGDEKDEAAHGDDGTARGPAGPKSALGPGSGWVSHLTEPGAVLLLQCLPAPIVVGSDPCVTPVVQRLTRGVRSDLAD